MASRCRVGDERGHFGAGWWTLAGASLDPAGAIQLRLTPLIVITPPHMSTTLSPRHHRHLTTAPSPRRAPGSPQRRAPPATAVRFSSHPPTTSLPDRDTTTATVHNRPSSSAFDYMHVRRRRRTLWDAYACMHAPASTCVSRVSSEPRPPSPHNTPPTPSPRARGRAPCSLRRRTSRLGWH